MSLKVTVIADDLTGALDTATPFAATGMRVAAAVNPSNVADAIATGAEVVAVNTASRSLPEALAATIAASAAEALKAAAPGLVFKKIDSRLKGNVRREIEAIAGVFGFDQIVVAPAVPDQGRLTVGGSVTGRGVSLPLPVARCVPDRARVVDAVDDADLDRVAATVDWSRTLAVGASGLGAALARRAGPAPARPLLPSRRTLFVIGSLDPITTEQVARLEGKATIHAVADDCRPVIAGLPAVLHDVGPSSHAVKASSRLVAAAMAAIEALRPDILVVSGGDTAHALLDALGASVVFPEGEARPGLPWVLVGRNARSPMRCVVKSGGFGGPETLASLIPG